MKANPKKSKFIYVVYIRTTPRKLWDALTDTDQLREYGMGRENTSTWKHGATLESRSPEGELEWHGRIIERKASHRLAYTFQGLDRHASKTRVAFDIEALGRKSIHRGDAVKLTVTHTGYASNSKDYKGISEGWPAIISGLKTLLETGRSLGIAYVG